MLFAVPAVYAQQKVGAEIVVGTANSSNNEVPAPKVAAVAGGGFVAVWAPPSGSSDTGIYGRRFDASGAALGDRFLVHEAAAKPNVAADGAGNFIIVWVPAVPIGGFSLVGQRFSGAGVPIGAVINVSASGGSSVAIASDAAGNFTVAWIDYDNVFARRFDAAGTALGAAFQVSTPPGNIGNVDVAVDSAGNVIVVWDQIDGGEFHIHARRYDSAGMPLGGDLLPAATPGEQFEPKVATDATGHFAVTWHKIGAPAAAIVVRRFDGTGTPIGGEMPVTTYGSSPDVAFDATGNFVLTWGAEDQYGDGSAVVARRYDASGLPVGGEFVVNTTTSGAERSAAIAMLGTDWVIAYGGLDDATAVVLAQRFTPGVPIGECAPSPQPCRTPTVGKKASLTLRNAGSRQKDSLVWKWASGSATTKAEFGDPVGSDDYRLCLYSAGNLRGRMQIPASGLCKGKPCWKEGKKGFQYKDKELTPNGGSSMKLLAGLDGKAQIQVKGAGVNLSIPAPLKLTSPLTVQLVNATSGLCWSAQYSFPPANALTPGVLSDKAD